ncbi:MAG: serine O-acetyltransferase [Actinomycetota bacterium]|nr:serine O-acetyltransferase [Actinomycetota bacterium]
MAEIRAKHPRFIAAVAADAKFTCAYRTERYEFTGRVDVLRQVLRLMWVSDAFAAQVFYRARARMQALGIPILPRLAHHLAMSKAQVCIGDTVVIEPGMYIPHGQVVIGGLIEIRRGVVIFPYVTIGVRGGGQTSGAVLGKNVRIGTGAKVLGPITVGEGARIGANAVVVDDVAPHTTVVGIPARPVYSVE